VVLGGMLRKNVQRGRQRVSVAAHSVNLANKTRHKRQKLEFRALAKLREGLGFSRLRLGMPIGGILQV